ncbi:class I SAM-dependent methyltransferase [Deinococcus radiotolerans]|uniref:Ubiquinone/menaquinone biosynthesis methyltransferase n=1 Tax=Deinococcus radiotolerans TaxID=1309407 RepID=A0ABQ2FKT7_9DEIO|nr:methyltransferase domain-containing protein [Deinococcus radiotolerans]GGL07961.1 ubiquinone/menaquinone biosynthesis methyltransferase [Deinococcus radiotolerans]
MDSARHDSRFDGSVPQLYEQYMVPLIFEPYAAVLAARVVARAPTRVLEVAAGTGVLTRRLARDLPAHVSIVATDLHRPMLDQAAATGTPRPVEWAQADAQHLPFPDATFDLVVCQFGVMFFPDRARAFAEARRVLRPGGQLLFSVWDRLERNEFAHEVQQAMNDVFPEDPPQFMARVPHGYHDLAIIARDLAGGGFEREPEFVTVSESSHADSPRWPAVAFCQGTPLRGEIEARGPGCLVEATDAATAALTRRFGPGPLQGWMQAVLVSATR